MNKTLVCVTPQANGKRLIDKGYQIVSAIGGELHILHVERGNRIFGSEESSQLLQALFDYASERDGVVHGICGEDVFETIKRFIKEEGITHAIFGASPASPDLSGENSIESSIESLRWTIPYLWLCILEREEEPSAAVL
ncbi:MAG: hypothetical protein LBT44_05230 [Clostridiales bacterium]|jgi:K+-sensing histidine kinase KdpD|nr:hypothetical protein [Clostridiales bacterium]